MAKNDILSIITSRPRLIFLTLCIVIGLIVLVQVQFTEFSSLGVSFGAGVFISDSQTGAAIVSPKPLDIKRIINYRTSDEHEDIFHPKKNANQDINVVIDENVAKAREIHNINVDPKSVVIGCAVTSRGVRGLTSDNIQQTFPLMRSLLPSFCKTASVGWNYHFYISHDHNDNYFIDAGNHKKFEEAFYNVVQTYCSNKIKPLLHFVKCSHSGNPAWAQNDAMIEAYIDNMAYFYRINDDTVMQSPGWTEGFIEMLGKYSPANVGVVGPMHRGGNEFILTYDFTHHTHVTIFGFYYPRIFTDWFADVWVTIVYQPGRSTKMQAYKLVHTMDTGTRYHVRSGKGELLAARLEQDRKVLQR